MRQRILILLLFSFWSIFGQQKINPKSEWIRENDTLRHKKQIRAEIIFKAGDTLRTHIKVRTNIFDSTLLDELSINKTIKTVVNGQIIKYRAQEIKSIRFIDFKNNERIFVEFSKELAELLLDGKIEWTRLYSSAGSVNFLTNKELNEFVMLSIFDNTRNQLKKITSLRPDLIPLIDSLTLSYKNIFLILKKYNE